MKEGGAASVAPLFRWLGRPGIWYGVPVRPGEYLPLPEHLWAKADKSDMWERKRGRKPKVVANGEDQG